MNTLQWVTKIVKEHNVKTMAEIGVLIGQLAEGVVTQFDMDRYVMVEKEINPKLLEMFERNKEKPLALIALPSVQAADLIADESLDMVYIDADHSYEEVRKDILKWVPKVKMGGIVSGHDYNPNGGFGVHLAVNELVNNFQLQPDDASVDNNIWWTIRKEDTLKPATVIEPQGKVLGFTTSKPRMITDFKDKKLVEYLEPGMKVLIRFGHGWGDTQMFYPSLAALRERYPETQIDLYVECGQEAIFESYPEKDSTEHDLIFSLDFPMSEGSNLTKAEKCCIEELGIIPPTQEFPKYIDLASPIVLVHFHGTALPGSVNCPEGVAQQIWKEIIEAGFIPMECHFEHVFHNPFNAKYGFVDSTVRKTQPKLSNLIALVQNSFAFIGVASGPFVTALSVYPQRTLYLEKLHKLENYTRNPNVRKVDITNYKPGTVKEWINGR